MSGEVGNIDDLFAAPAGKPARGAAPREGSIDELFAEAPAKPAASGKLNTLATVGKDTLMNLAGVADMILSLPGQAIGVGGNIGMRARAAAAGIDRRTAAQMAAKFEHDIADPLSNPLRKLMGLFGYGEQYDASDVSAVMNKASGLIGAGGEWVEKHTNGALLKEDVQALTNELMFAAGGRGTAYVVDPKLKAMGQSKGPYKVPPESGNSPQGPGSYGAKVEDVGPAPEAAAADSSAYLSWLERKGKTADLPNLDKIRNAEQRAYDLMQRGASKAEVDRAVARDPLLGEALAAVRVRRGDAAGASSGAFVGGVEADVVGPAPRGPRWQAGPANYMDVPEIVSEASPVRRRQLPLGPLAAGGVAAGAAAYEYLGGGDTRDQAVAGLAALTLADLGKMSAATPLAAILERSDYTLKTFDRLPQNRFEFTREQVMQQLNRPDVSKAEKDIVLQVLGDKQKISAQELMTRFKEVTGDFELKGKDVSDYADYGLNQIDRTDSYGAPAEAIEAQNPRTTIYQSPVELGDANHFSDPNYFAHARSFDEGGVRHVVELQSDVVQKAKPPLTPERVAELERQFSELEKFHIVLDDVITTWDGGKTTLAGIREKLAPFRDQIHDAARTPTSQRASELPEVLLREARVAYKILGERMDAVRAQLDSQITPAKRAELKQQIERGEIAQRVWDRVGFTAGRAGDYDFFAGLEAFKRGEKELSDTLGHTDQTVMLESKLLQNMAASGVESNRLVNMFVAEKTKHFTPGEMASYERGYMDISDGFVDWLLKHKSELPRDEANIMRGVLQRYAQAKANDFELWQTEANSKLRESNAEAVRPMFKDWYKRIVREELDAAAKVRDARLKSDADLEADIKLYQEGIKRGDPEFIGANAYVDDLIRQRGVWEGKRNVPVPADTVRFATADTVAKVEGWPKGLVMEPGRVAKTDALNNLTRVGSIKDVDGLKDFGEFKYTGNLRTLDGHRIQVEMEPTGTRVSSHEGPFWVDEPASNRLKEIAMKELGAKEALRPEHQGIYDRYKKDVEKFLTKDLGGKPYTDDQGHTWIEVPLPKRSTTGRPGGPKQMMGFADPKLLAGIAAIGGGLALANSWDELSGIAKTAGSAAIIGLGLLAAGRTGTLSEWASVAGQTAEKTLGNISAEVRVMSPKLLRQWTRFEWQSLVRQHKATQAAAPFIQTLNKLSPEARTQLALAAMTGKESAVLQVFQSLGKPELISQWRVVRAQLDELGGELKEAGLLKNLRRDYFPRVVTDIDGLLEAVGRESGDFLEQKLSAANRESIKKTGQPMSQLEASILINRHLEEAIRRGGSGGKAGFLKKRSIEDVSESLLPFYAPPAEALAMYMRSASRQVERAKFFGKNLVRDSETGLTNIDDSIGRVVAGLGDDLTRAQRARLEDLLRSRFGPGERAADRVTQAYRNVVQGALLGNPFSAVGQLADVGVTAAMHGVMPTVKALWQTAQEARASARGKGRGEAGRYNLDDMGLVDRIADEFVTSVHNPLMVKGIEISTANFADKALKWSGFNFTDEFGKLVNMNAAANSLRAKARTPGGRAELQARYGDYFGTDMPQLLKDLAAGKKTQLTGEAVFRELSDVQPLTKLEMPQAYVGNPSMRWLYTMKSWMIKQMNLIRERGVREMASGDLARAKRGAEFLVRYAALAGIAGASVEMVRNWLMGRGLEMEWGDVPENILKTFGFGSYVRDKIAQGKPLAAIGSTVVPPYRLFDEIAAQDPRAISYIPIVGKFAYEHFGGGKEKAAERKYEEGRRQERDADVDTFERDERRQRKLERQRNIYETGEP